MKIADILEPELVVCGVDVPSKKRVLEKLSELLSSREPGLERDEVLNSLIARERLGSTGLGHGVAIPHGRVGGITRTRGAFVRTGHGVDFDSIDDQPVDLLFALLVPEDSTDEHLQVLASLAEMFSDDGFVSRLRGTGTCAELFSLLTGQPGEPEP